MTPVVRATKEAAERAGFAPGSFNNMRVSGRGPRYVKAGRKVLYRDGDVDEWLASQVRSSTSETVAG